MKSPSDIWESYEKALERLSILNSPTKRRKTVLEVVFAVLRRLRIRIPLQARTFFHKKMFTVLPEYSSCSILQTGIIDPETPLYFRAVLSEGMTVFDVGAHFGFYTLLAKRLIGNLGRVCAFEPSPETFRVLQRNVRKLANTVALELAVSSQIGESFFIALDCVNSAFSRVQSKNDPLLLGSHILVKKTSLDAYCARNAIVPDLVKFDVEGHEMECLLGFQTVLKKHRAAIILEFNHDEADDLKPAEFLLDHGYSSFGLKDNHVTPVDLQLIQSCRRGCNFLFVHQSGKSCLI
jgi:FkbM family methyltransferase